MLINTLILRNADDSIEKIGAGLLSEFQQSYVVETTQGDKSYDTSSNVFNSICYYLNGSNIVSYKSLNNLPKFVFYCDDCMYF